jgi:molecular chaperone DnaJ
VRRHVRIRVPAGVVDGQVLRVRGQGHCGRFGGAPGDLLVKLQVGLKVAGVLRG